MINTVTGVFDGKNVTARRGSSLDKTLRLGVSRNWNSRDSDVQSDVQSDESVGAEGPTIFTASWSVISFTDFMPFSNSLLD